STYGAPNAESTNIMATLCDGRRSFRISESFASMIDRSMVASPGIRIAGIERASKPRRKTITFQAPPRPVSRRAPGFTVIAACGGEIEHSAAASDVEARDQRIVREAGGRTLLRFPDALLVDELQLARARRYARRAHERNPSLRHNPMIGSTSARLN